MDKIIEIKIKDEFITLGQLLKIADLVNSGGEVKHFLNTNEVKVNNESDQRRGRKLHKGDEIQTIGRTYKIC